jgi:hypothetical protein
MVPFDIEDLRRRGFEGFLPVERLEGPQPEELPLGSGVYVVVPTAPTRPEFLERSGAGWWKRRDPTVPVERLRREWVEDAQTLYIGKAKCLRERVGLLLDFGRGDPVMHYGGRPEKCFAAVETRLIDELIGHFGRLPFANLRRGDRVCVPSDHGTD